MLRDDGLRRQSGDRVGLARLTVIDQPVCEMGKKPAERLISRLNGKEMPVERTAVEMNLIQRGSVVSPPHSKEQ